MAAKYNGPLQPRSVRILPTLWVLLSSRNPAAVNKFKLGKDTIIQNNQNLGGIDFIPVSENAQRENNRFKQLSDDYMRTHRHQQSRLKTQQKQSLILKDSLADLIISGHSARNSLKLLRQHTPEELNEIAKNPEEMKTVATDINTQWVQVFEELRNMLNHFTDTGMQELNYDQRFVTITSDMKSKQKEIVQLMSGILGNIEHFGRHKLLVNVAGQSSEQFISIYTTFTGAVRELFQEALNVYLNNVTQQLSTEEERIRLANRCPHAVLLPFYDFCKTIHAGFDVYYEPLRLSPAESPAMHQSGMLSRSGDAELNELCSDIRKITIREYGNWE